MSEDEAREECYKRAKEYERLTRNLRFIFVGYLILLGAFLAWIFEVVNPLFIVFVSTMLELLLIGILMNTFSDMKKQKKLDKQMKKKREEGMRNIVDRWHHQGMNLDYYYYPRGGNLWPNDIFIGVLGLLLFLFLVSRVCIIFFV